MTSSARSLSIRWKPWQGAGDEQLTLTFGPDGAEAKSELRFGQEGEGFACNYALATDPAWHVRELKIEVSGGAALHLESDGEGHWRMNGESEPGLAGCIDIDIQATPFTNTLPIRRLGLREGEAAEIRVVYIPVPSLQPRAVEQRYTCIKAFGAGEGTYRYEGLFRNFTAYLPVDESHRKNRRARR